MSYKHTLKVFFPTIPHMNSTSKPMATISFKGILIVQSSSAPRVLSFTSKGPNMASPGILKPDIIGPGVNILASWPFPVDKHTNPNSAFHVSTGTSIACPHLSGIAALLKRSHPDWSPASTVDRKIVATTKLGNGEEFDGESVHRGDFASTSWPLVYAGSNGKSDSAFCDKGSLKDIDVKNKVVLCERGGGVGRIAKGQEVKNAGGAAMILVNQESDGFSTIADPHALPAVHVSFADGLKIKAYINSTATPTATLFFKGTVIGDSLAPVVASFSSRGPNLASPGILKPDIIGPGVSILAAWPFPLYNDTDPKSPFNIMSGTSMSCPHLSGIAALLKSSHPYWSPAAIKSAIMTTADIVNLEGRVILDQALIPADVSATGAGHVNPTRANDPGLVYDLQPDDYITYLCGLGYKEEQVGLIAHRPIKCSKESSIPEGELNYPSFSVTVGPSQTFTRTVTNVGEAYSTYAANIVAPDGVYVSVNPSKLYFSKVNQKATYSVTFSRITSSGKTGTYGQGSLTWVSAKHYVRSPISVKFQ